jgi:hypothetical protein
MSNLLQIVGGVISVLALYVGLGIMIAFFVYIYPAAPFFLWVVWFYTLSIVFLLFVAIAGGISAISSTNETDREFINVAIFIVPFLIFLLLASTSYILHLSDYWGITLEKSIMRPTFEIPHRTISFFVRFFNDLSEAMFGQRQVFEPLAVPNAQMATLPRMDRPQSNSPIIQWAIDSAWNLFLGVASGAITAVLLKAK